MSTPDSEAIAASWPSVPLSQATTLCGSEISDKTNEPVAKQLHSHSSTLPTLSYLSKPVLKSFDSIAGSIKSTEGGKQSKTGLQKIRGNDWVIVIVCAYCECFHDSSRVPLFVEVITSRLKCSPYPRRPLLPSFRMHSFHSPSGISSERHRCLEHRRNCRVSR